MSAPSKRAREAFQTISSILFGLPSDDERVRVLVAAADLCGIEQRVRDEIVARLVVDTVDELERRGEVVVDGQRDGEPVYKLKGHAIAGWKRELQRKRDAKRVHAEQHRRNCPAIATLGRPSSCGACDHCRAADELEARAAELDVLVRELE